MSNTNINSIPEFSPQEEEIFLKGGKKGLCNLSNTCYMNSAIQALLHTIPLTQWFLRKEYTKELNKNRRQRFLVYVWKKLTSEYWLGTTNAQKELVFSHTPLRPTDLHSIIHLLASEVDLNLYQLGNQNDIQEFLQFFIDSIHEALACKIKVKIRGQIKSPLDRITIEGHKQWGGSFSRSYSEMVRIFYGQYISTLTCQTCLNESQRFDPVCYLTLSIPATNKKGVFSIYDCLNLFTQPEMMDGDNKVTCDNCKCPREQEKTIALWRTPNVLIVLLKRFRSFGQNSAKINNMVNYPFRLDLSPYCGSSDKLNSQYDLYAVCNHVGNVGGGHYYAYCKDMDGKWRTYNDSSVSEMKDSDVIAQSAYCLFYHKVNPNS